MAKGLRFIVALLVVVLAFIIWWWGRGSGAGGADAGIDAGVIMTSDSGSVETPPDAGMIDSGEAEDSGAGGGGDAGSPTTTPSCGACSYNPTTGALSILLQKRYTSVEPAHNWTVLGVEIVYNGAPPVNRSVISGATTITAADASCGVTKTMTLQTAPATNIRAINLRLQGPGAPGPIFKRGCVKLASSGGVPVVLENNCSCCGCAGCADTGTCP